MSSQIVSGYCSCGFPASVRCPKCLVKLCGNCLLMHKCSVPLTEPEPEPEPVKAEPVAIPEDNQNEAIREMTRKPGRPKVRK